MWAELFMGLEAHFFYVDSVKRTTLFDKIVIERTCNAFLFLCKHNYPAGVEFKSLMISL